MFLPQHKNKVTVVGSSPLLGSVEWATMDGGDLTHSITKLRRTAGAAKEVLAADYEFDNITLEAYVDPVAHADFLIALKNGERFENSTIRQQGIDNAGIPIGKPIEYFGCSVAKSSPPRADANGEEPTVVTVEWAVGS